MLYFVFLFFCLDADRELESPEYLEEEEEARVPVRQLPQPRLISRRIGVQLDTEHVHLRKCSVDHMFLCEPCAVRYCHENRMDYYLLFTEHNIMNPIEAAANYAVEKCQICQAGTMSVFNQRGCSACRCLACDRIPPGMGRCENCQRSTLLFGCVIRRMKAP